jgi:hypothetical protein
MASKFKLYFFRRKYIFFIPIHIVGWLFLLAVIAVGIFAFRDLYLRTYSIGETLSNFAIFLIILFIGYTMFAFYTCKPDKETIG